MFLCFFNLISRMDLPVELLCMIFVCLLADDDPAYLRTRVVCRYWYQIYTDLVHRGYVMSRESILQNLWKRPNAIRTVHCRSGEILTVARCCARLNDVNLYLDFSFRHNLEALGAKHAIMAGFNSYFTRSYYVPNHIFMSPKVCACVYYYEITQLYHKIHKTWRHLMYTMPSRTLPWYDRLPIPLIFPNFSTLLPFMDRTKIADRILLQLKSMNIQNEVFVHALGRQLRETIIAYEHHDVLIILLQNYEKPRVGELAAGDFGKNNQKIIDFYINYTILNQTLRLYFIPGKNIDHKMLWITALTALGHDLLIS
jgi:hypothetical protein